MELNPQKKFEEMFERRASQGQCFMQPYLGCREFSAYFHLLKDEDNAFKTITETRELGWMLYDLEYANEEIRPKFFKAVIDQGVVHVPAKNSTGVRG